jgi:hypothetical protein
MVLASMYMLEPAASELASYYRSSVLSRCLQVGLDETTQRIFKSLKILRIRKNALSDREESSAELAIWEVLSYYTITY